MASIARKQKINNFLTPPGLDYEKILWQAGLHFPAGLDEAGRGAWAGPVAAAAVILPHDRPDIAATLRGVRDSKQMTARQRQIWAGRIRKEAAAWAIGLASCEEIDQVGILRATRMAMCRALEALCIPPQHLLLDAVLLRDIDLPQTALIRGDALSLSISAASVLAKTARDEIMSGMEVNYPGYGFCRHKGYGTRLHQQALQEKGVCEIHRRSFAPVRDRLEKLLQ